MRFSVVIPAFNGLTFLKANLPAVTALQADEIIVVNDGSSDRTVEIVQEYPPHIAWFHSFL